MKRNRWLTGLLLPLVVLLTSCFKEDERVIPSRPGDVITQVIEMQPDYSIQSYFNLNSGKVVGTGFRNTWDIGLSCKENDYTLILNTSRFMKVAHTGSDFFEAVYTTEGFEWRFDESTADPAGNAIGKWWETTVNGPVGLNEVLLVDLGIDADGLPAGYLKIQPLINTLTKVVSIKIAGLDNTGERTFAFSKDSAYRYVTMSFDDGQNASPHEPVKTAWDLQFTQYTTLLFTDDGEPYPYLVTGVLINDSLVSAVMDSITPFESIDRNFAEGLLLSNKRDVIGYDWKQVVGDVSSGNVTYIARPEMGYIIKSADGYFFKLRFIDFYNNLGKKGYPTFEYQKL
jgi:hypothetical protein